MTVSEAVARYSAVVQERTQVLRRQSALVQEAQVLREREQTLRIEEWQAHQDLLQATRQSTGLRDGELVQLDALVAARA